MSPRTVEKRLEHCLFMHVGAMFGPHASVQGSVSSGGTHPETNGSMDPVEVSDSDGSMDPIEESEESDSLSDQGEVSEVARKQTLTN